MPLRIFTVTGTSSARLAHRRPRRWPRTARLPRQRRPAALAGDLGHRAAEVEVDVVGAVLGDEHARRQPGGRRVHAVELHRARVLVGVVRDQAHRLGRALDQRPGGDHLARRTGSVAPDAPPASSPARAVLAAQPPEGAVGDAGHRRQHHGRLDDVAADVQRGQHRVPDGDGGGGGDGGNHGAHAPARSRVVPWHCSRREGPWVPTGVRATWLGHSTRAARARRACACSPIPSCAAASAPCAVAATCRCTTTSMTSTPSCSATCTTTTPTCPPAPPGHVPVVTDPANLPWLDKQSLECSARRSPTRGSRSAPGVEVSLVRADHEARPMPHRPNGATGMLRARGRASSVWFAGDTSLHPDMALLPELAGAPDRPRPAAHRGWGPRLSGGHMGPARGGRRSRRAPGPGTFPDPLRHPAPARAGRRPAGRGPPTPADRSVDVPAAAAPDAAAPRPAGGRRRHVAPRRAALTSSHRAAAVSFGWVSGKTCSPRGTVTTCTQRRRPGRTSEPPRVDPQLVELAVHQQHRRGDLGEHLRRHSPMTPAHAAGIPSKP